MTDFKKARNQKRKKDRCPCGGVILADTEDWATPLCYGCYPKDLVDKIEKLNSHHMKMMEKQTRISAHFFDKLKTKDAVIEKLKGALKVYEHAGCPREQSHAGKVLEETKQMLKEG